MNNDYKIIRTIFENIFQRVLECKGDDIGDVFYNNVITSQKIINLIDIDGLNSLNSNVLKCYRTEDRVFILTKSLDSLEFQGRSIKEYVSNSNLSLKQQYELSKKIIELSNSIFGLTDVVQQKILDLDKIYINEHENIIVDCNLIFEQEYDIQDNETFKRMGNILHYVFSGTEILDYNISELVPPDMLKIIVRCLTKEYIYPKDALAELNNSPIYNMINPNANKQNMAKPGIDQLIIPKYNKHKDILDESMDISSETDSSFYAGIRSYDGTLDIYLRDGKYDNEDYKDTENNETENDDKKKGLLYYLGSKAVKQTAISLVIIIFVLIVGSFLIKKYNKDSENVFAKNMDSVQPDEDVSNNSQIVSNDDNLEDINSDSNDITDSTSRFFNKQLLSEVGYTGNVAEIDKAIYVEGNESLVVKNNEDGKVRALFATINFTDPEYSYMLKKQIAIAAKTKSESDVSSLIVLEAFKDGKLASTFHTTTQIYNDMWSQNTVPINVTSADSLNIYIEYSGKNKVWIDSIYIDVVK
jgi:hypothetical protein